MTENSTQEVVKDLEEYKFGFHDNAELEFTTWRKCEAEEGEYLFRRIYQGR